MTLAQLQAAYRDFLLTGRSETLVSSVIADAFDGAERLAVYRNNFLLGLAEALKANFPVTLRLLGRAFFEQATRHFVPAHPPRRPCLFEYGAAFPDWLGNLPELRALPYVAQVARFEFARIASYNAPVEDCISAARLAALTPDELAAVPVRRAGHAQVIAVDAPVAGLWTAHQAAEPDLSAIDMQPRPHTLLVCRPDRILVVRELDARAARFLAAIGEETELGSAAAQSGAEDEAALGRIIALALELRLLVTRAP